MLDQGRYKVKVVGCFSGQSGEKKTPFCGLEFETESGQSIDWVGWLSERAKDRTQDTLLECGFLGKRMADLSDANKSIDDLFGDIGDDIFIVIEHEEYTHAASGEIKVKATVKWVNIGSGGVSKFDHTQAIEMFKGMDLEGGLMEKRKALGKKVIKKETADSGEYAGAENTTFEADDIPF